jgi:hypothetical protein
MTSPPLADASDDATPAAAPEAVQVPPHLDVSAQLHARRAQLTVDSWLREVASS